MKKILSILLALVLSVSMFSFAGAQEAQENVLAGAEMAEEAEVAQEAGAAWWNQVDPEDAEDQIEIYTADDLQAINNDLSANYILMADIDLDGIEWAPLGIFLPADESEEEQELPDPDFAFTGNFNGNGHTISNLVIDRPEAYSQGLFGCIAGAKVGYFTLENAQVTGTMMSGDVGSLRNSGRFAIFPGISPDFLSALLLFLVA